MDFEEFQLELNPADFLLHSCDVYWVCINTFGWDACWPDLTSCVQTLDHVFISMCDSQWPHKSHQRGNVGHIPSLSGSLQKTAPCCSTQQHKFTTTSSESELNPSQRLPPPSRTSKSFQRFISITSPSVPPLHSLSSPLLAHLLFKRRLHLKALQSSISQIYLFIYLFSQLLRFHSNQSEIIKKKNLNQFLPIWQLNGLHVQRSCSPLSIKLLHETLLKWRVSHLSGKFSNDRRLEPRLKPKLEKKLWMQ